VMVPDEPGRIGAPRLSLAGDRLDTMGTDSGSGPLDPATSDLTTRDTTTLDYLTHLARDSARFVEVLRQAPAGARVPTCADWDADNLLWHLTTVQWFWGMIVGRALTASADVEALEHNARPGDREELIASFRRASDDLVRHLRAAPPDMPAWTWSDEQSVGFIRRRQAHEALIHRLDAELTVSDRTPMDAGLSADGVDEILRVMYGSTRSRGHFTPDATGTVRVRGTDMARSWLLTLGQLTGTDDDDAAHDGPGLVVAESDTGEPAAATVSGAAADLDCWLWHRPSAGQLERSGDPLVLERLEQFIARGIS
jgi:uncharacterized protein (TIGR03083 family)